ncbi:hypothetical protein CTI12_AA516140 [Artemisia annua]|uniref:Uncharacterized protein n=1 Tax=Artemisia annua TaxID=35608 RepID=A0A2U1L9C8_ARTAN|nr:hypothetical protein CTI12_AA516140 [Artemisia annua]
MGVKENKSGNWPNLKYCDIRNGLEGKWETLTSSSLSLLREWSQTLIPRFFLNGPFNISDVRTKVLFPATNVEKLSFETFRDDGLVENSVLLFDALFSICQPLYVEAHLQMRLKVADYFLKLIDMGVKENKSGNWPNFKYCEIRNGLEGKWETLTSSSLSLLREWSQWVFKITRCSP